MAKYKKYIVRAVEEELGDCYFEVKVPKETPQEEVFNVFDNASKYASYFDGDLDEDEGVEEYDEHYMEAVEKDYESYNGLDRFTAYLQDFHNWEVEDYYIQENYRFEW